MSRCLRARKVAAACLALACGLAPLPVPGAEPVKSFGVVVEVPVPGGGVLFFEAGRWYRQDTGKDGGKDGGRWVSSGSPRGPWLVVPQSQLPAAIIDLPALTPALPRLAPPGPR